MDQEDAAVTRPTGHPRMTPQARDRALRRLSVATGLVTVSAVAATGAAVAAAAHDTGRQEAAKPAAPAGDARALAPRHRPRTTHVYGATPAVTTTGTTTAIGPADPSRTHGSAGAPAVVGATAGSTAGDAAPSATSNPSGSSKAPPAAATT